MRWGFLSNKLQNFTSRTQASVLLASRYAMEGCVDFHLLTSPILYSMMIIRVRSKHLLFAYNSCNREWGISIINSVSVWTSGQHYCPIVVYNIPSSKNCRPIFVYVGHFLLSISSRNLRYRASRQSFWFQLVIPTGLHRHDDEKIRRMFFPILSWYKVACRFDELQTTNDWFRLPATKLKG
jgi:hypothetical protein